MRRVTLVAGLAAMISLAGCAPGTESSGGGGGAGPTTSGPAPTSPAPNSPTGTRQPPSAPTLVLDGVAERGVEPGCVVLHAAGKQYVLVGAGGATLTGVPMQVPIRVRASVLTGVFSYCQQGTTLQVTQISRR
jgi:hypothetical protein